MKTRGFTLIELLVVIAIIGLLSSVVLVSLNTARAKARNAQRLSTLGQYILALELAYDANGTYPVLSTGVSSCLGTYSDGRCWVNFTQQAAVTSALSPFLPSFPTAELVPIAGTPRGFMYGYCPNSHATVCTGIPNGAYFILFFQEGENASCGPGGVKFYDPSLIAGTTYCLIGKPS